MPNAVIVDPPRKGLDNVTIKNLKKLKIPDKVTTLDRAVTGGCSNLEVLILGNGISNNIDANNFRCWITTFKDNSYRK